MVKKVEVLINVCQTCNGTGILKLNPPQYLDGTLLYLPVCDICHGSGKFDDGPFLLITNGMCFDVDSMGK